MHQVIPCASTQAVSDAINGTIMLGRPIKARETLPLGGLTLVFTTPARTVTFGSPGDKFTMKEVAEEIKTAHADFSTFVIVVRPVPDNIGYTVAIQNDTGFTIDNVGTANSLLGLSTTEDTVSEGLVPFADFSVTQGNYPGHYLVIIDGGA
jgi:hypothetical protein